MKDSAANIILGFVLGLIIGIVGAIMTIRIIKFSEPLNDYNITLKICLPDET